MVVRGRHRKEPENHGEQQSTPVMRRSALAVMVATAVTVGWGTAPAAAVPEQGGTRPSAPPEQDGTGGSNGPQQGGTTAPPAAPPGPGLQGVPEPPPTTNWVPADPAPSYPDPYQPIINVPTTPPQTLPEAPPRVAPAPDTVRLGNITIPVEDLPQEMQNDRAINSFNSWAAYGESEIARGLIAMGVPEDEASRQAAAAIIGAVAGGAAGGAIAFTATAVVVGIVAIPIATLAGTAIGAAIGVGVPPPGVNVGPGALIGAGAGAATGVAITLAAATAAGIAGATVGALIFGGLAYALGAGDPGASQEQPRLPWEPTPEEEQQQRDALPNPDANQFEFLLAAEDAARAGLPPVDYVVNSGGDVSVTTSIAGRDLDFGWSAEQAQAPIKALGPLAPAAEQAINDTTRSVTNQLSGAIPGLDVSWPQLAEAAEESAPEELSEAS